MRYFPYKHAIFIFILISGFCTGSYAQTVQGYFVKFSDPHSFMPLIVGGNGKFILGQSSGGKDLSLWTRTGGVKVLQVAPDGYDLLPKAANFDGSYVVGVIQKYPAQPVTDEGVMFWWSSADGLHLLTPLGQKADDVGQIDISSDGKIVEFFCPELSLIPTCPGSNSAPAAWLAKGRVWTLSNGFQVLGKNIKQHFDFIKTTGDFRSFVYADMHSVVLDQSTKQLDAPVLDFRGENEKFVELKDIPPFSKINSSGYGYNSLFEMRSIIMNENASRIAFPGIFAYKNHASRATLIWDKDGNQVVIKNLPAGCGSFVPSQITNTEEYFGVASCTGAAAGVALHVTLNDAQTIGDWLKRSGIKNKLSVYTEINSISSDGKTILGWTNLYPMAETMQATAGQTDVLPLPRHDARHTLSDRAYLFVAHIP